MICLGNFTKARLKMRRAYVLYMYIHEYTIVFTFLCESSLLGKDIVELAVAAVRIMRSDLTKRCFSSHTLFVYTLLLVYKA